MWCQLLFSSPLYKSKKMVEAKGESSNSKPVGATDSVTTNSSLSAAYGILPAVASTMCCWGPPLVGIVGAAVGGSVGAGNSALVLSRRITKYRPYLLGVSATMIGYSFLRVYGPQTPHNDKGCCEHQQNNAVDADKNLKFQRAVVWTSLAMAIAGASYGRVKIPRTVFSSPTSTASTIISKNKTLLSATELRVEGMACGGCASKVRNVIESIHGVQIATVDHAKGKVLVEATKDVTYNTIKAAIGKAGFHVQD